MRDLIEGATAGEIAESIRNAVDAGHLVPGTVLPSVRSLAEGLGVNRNTVVSAYRQLTVAGITVARGRAGTSVSDVRPRREEGAARSSVLVDIGSGNPAAHMLPPLRAAFDAPGVGPVLYGNPLIDPDLERSATAWISIDQPRLFRLSLTSGAVDAVERLLTQALTHGDAVALEDPCFLSSINTVLLGGYKTIPVSVDDDGMTVEGLRKALTAGARAIVCTPRAHNPTGVSLTQDRAEALRAVLSDYPHVLIIEDDHFSQLSHSQYNTIISPEHKRWALVRSVSKFLGPDLRLAFVASDTYTADRLRQRLSPGSMWVSHYLQRLVSAAFNDELARERVSLAADFYAECNASFLKALAQKDITASASDGLNIWLHTGTDASRVAEELMRRGWLCRVGQDFALTSGGSAGHLRLTIHSLTEQQRADLVHDLAAVLHDDHTSRDRGQR